MEGLRAICDREGILLVVDEVQTGFGRTGRMFAIEHYGVEPDLMTVAKSIAGGLPLSGVAGQGRDHGLALGQRASAAPTSAIPSRSPPPSPCSTCSRKRRSSSGRSRSARPIRARMLAWQERFAAIGDVRGLGAMLAVEYVEDRETKAPAPGVASRVAEEAALAGCCSCKAGIHSNCNRVLCPLVITDAELEEGLAAWEEALEAVLA